MAAVRAVLFDKDGTLFDFYKTWGPVTEAAALAVADGDKAKADHILVNSGKDMATGRYVPGSPIASGSNQEIAQLWADLLGRSHEVADIYRHMEAMFLENQKKGAVPVVDLPVFFQRLRGRGLKLGIATMDSEQGALAAMERYAAGDDSAFGDLYDLLAPRLYDYLASQVRNRALAEDLVQQTFLQLHRARGSFLAGADVRPWAFAIARRLMIDGFRRNKLETAQLAEESRKPEGGSAEAPDQQLAAKQLAARVADALDKMPESQRTAFQLVKQNGLSLAQAAEVLGTTITAVKLRLHRAVQGLRAVTGDESGDFE